MTSQRARPRSTAWTRSLTWPSSMSTSLPIWRTEPSTAGLIGRSPSCAASSPAITSVVAARERDRRLEVADAKLRALQVGDQGDRPARRRLGLAHEAGAHPVVLVVAVRHVEPRAVHAGLDQRRDRLGGRARRGRSWRRSSCAGRACVKRRRLGARGNASQPGYTAVFAELVLDPQQLVVLRGAVGARRGAGLDLTAARGDRDVGDRRVLGLSRPVRDDRRVAAALRELDRVERLRQRADLVDLDEDRVRRPSRRCRGGESRRS